MSGLPQIDVLPGWNCYDWRNAFTILRHAHSPEWGDILAVLSTFRLRHVQLAAKGRNKTEIAAEIDGGFYARGWKETKFDTKIVVDQIEMESPTHSIDCFKGRVALELEWNNKDPFYDRDLNNFRLLYDLRIADVGVVVTRSTSLQRWLHQRFKLFEKDRGTFGASTTHFDKLEPKIVGGGAGGCPVFVFSMTEQLYVDDRPAPPSL
jgi:hypothetical protein